ncbi:hypothetical protein HMPREF2542_01825 [Streptococcus sp. HMSC034B05]|nr:hypothetical protein HMPREF2542_01825 [Streptococcus sp. HMSC034B05]
MFILEKIFYISNTALLRLEKFQNWGNSNATALFILFFFVTQLFIHSIPILSILLTGSAFSMMISYVLIDAYLKLRVYY